MSLGKTIAIESENRINVERLKTSEKLSYLMLPILNELQEANKEEIAMNESWKYVCVDEIADYLEILKKRVNNSEELFVYYDIMRKSTYLVSLDLWIQTIEILIYEQEQ